MKEPFRGLVQELNRVLLGLIGKLVPRDQRSDWRSEWLAELWHVEQAGTADPWSTIHFTLGALPDARCLRQASAAPRIPFATTRGSAFPCLGALLCLVRAGTGTGLLLSGVRAQVRPARYRAPHDLVLVQSALHGEESSPTVSTAQFRRWREQPRLFAASAFYEMRTEKLVPVEKPQTIAYASRDLLALLKVPTQHTVPEAQGLPRLVLSDKLWRDGFHSNPQVLGTSILVGSQQARIAGVAAADAWHLPGRPDAWLLEPDTAVLPAGEGFVVAHLSPRAPRQHFGRIGYTYAYRAEETTEDLSFTNLSEHTQGPWGVLLFAILLAALALPATTPLSLGEYRMPPSRSSWSTRLRRWSFLAAKVALLLLGASWISLDLAYANPSLDWRTSVYLQLVSGFGLCLFGLRWALRDQRQRCPMCLGRLTHPARVGEPSRSFLAWNGTELMCVGGHGLLHVPEMATSWFRTQRWVYLDPSWDVLFVLPDGRAPRNAATL